MDRQALRAEEQFGGAQHVGIITSIERVAQDEMHQLIEKERRQRNTVAHQRDIRCFQRVMGCEMVAERDHDIASSPVHRLPQWRRSPPPRRAAMDRHNSAECSLRSAAQASGGGASSGRAR